MKRRNRTQALAAMAGDLGELMSSARRLPELRQGTRVKLRVSDPRYDGCEGVVLTQGRGEARGRIGVELIYGPKELLYGAKKQLSVGRDKLLVLSPGHEASDETEEVSTLPSFRLKLGNAETTISLPLHTHWVPPSGD